jgi:steroid 5-alpha reductase family enzyme
MILSILLLSFGLCAFMTLAWVFQRRADNAGWVDVFWTAGLGVAGVAVALLPFSGSPNPRQILVACLIGIWALRLGLHLFVRVSHSAEDVRYANFRKVWGANYNSRMFWFLQIQAAAAIILAISVLLAAHNPAPMLRAADWAGAVILAVAIIGEGIGDDQLRRFKSIPANKGRVCDVGLWAWSRHPNYFFEWLGWVAYPVMAIDLSGQYPWGWIALSAPIFMYWLLAHVSGVPPLEEMMLKSRGDAYRAYQATTSAFFPWPPRRPASQSAVS